MKLGTRSHLANRILSMVAAIIFAMTVVFVAFYSMHTRRILDAQQRDEGISLCESIAGASELGVLSGDKSFLLPIFNNIMDHKGASFMAAYDAEGRIIYEASNRQMDLSLPAETVAVLMKAGVSTYRGTIELPDEEIDDFYAPVLESGYEEDWSESLLGTEEEAKPRRGRPIGIVRMGLSREEIARVQRQSLAFSLSAAVVIMALGILIASLVSRRITEPIAKLEQVTKRITDGDLDVSLEVASNDEVGSLASAFNSMASALKQTTVSKDYVDSIVSSMNDSLFVFSADRTIAGINDAASALLGYEHSELEGRPADVLFADTTPIDTATWNEIGQGATLANAEVEFLRKDGDRVKASLSVAAMFDNHGRLRGAVGVARDITEVQRLLNELRSRSDELERHRVVLTSMLEDNERARAVAEAERQKTRAAVDSMAEGLVMFGAASEILLLNPAARRMLRLAEGEEAETGKLSRLLGFDLRPFLSSGSSDESATLLHDATVGEEHRRTLRIEGLSVEHAGLRIGSMLVMRDVTRERQLDEAKHELLTNVSHELRTPLAAISNIISNTLVGVTGTISDKLRSHLEIARINTKRLSNIIDNLLDIASLDAGSVTIRREPADFGALADEVVRSLEPEMAQKGIRFDKQPPSEPVEIYCDTTAIAQVMRNLLTNAIRFTPQDGIVRLMMERVGDQIEVAVVDSGVGIPPEDQPSIFERFHQVGRTYGPGEKGLGLGLSISRHLVEMHGGTIGLTSSQGRGSRFYFRLPLFSGTALIDAYLSDRLQEMARGGAIPRLWTFSPSFIEGSERVDEGDLFRVAAERLESLIREVLVDTKHVVSHVVEANEVLAVVMEKRDGATNAERVEAAVKRFSFSYADRSVVCEAAVGSAVCADAQTKPSHYIESARKSARSG